MNDSKDTQNSINNNTDKLPVTQYLLIVCIIVSVIAVSLTGMALTGDNKPVEGLIELLLNGTPEPAEPTKPTEEPTATPTPTPTPTPTAVITPSALPGFTPGATTYEPGETQTTVPAPTAEPTPTPTPVPTPEPTRTPSYQEDTHYFDDALFVGDSRMYGMSRYGTVQGAQYFAKESMRMASALNCVAQNRSDGLKLKEYMQQNTFGKIYLLLGINEYGSKPTAIKRDFAAFIAFAKELYPDVKIFILGNMHITADRSKDGVEGKLSNTIINSINAELKTLDDGKTVFYLDTATLYDNGDTGCMDSKYTGDGLHLRAKHYVILRDWIYENGRRY